MLLDLFQQSQHVFLTRDFFFSFGPVAEGTKLPLSAIGTSEHLNKELTPCQAVRLEPKEQQIETPDTPLSSDIRAWRLLACSLEVPVVNNDSLRIRSFLRTSSRLVLNRDV